MLVENEINNETPSELELNEGEVVCPECNGEGKISVNDELMRGCSRCYGSKKLDWIEMATGKHPPISSSTTSSGGSWSSCSFKEGEKLAKFRDFLRRRKENNERNNVKSKFRTVQRFPKVSYKFKRNM